MAKKKVGLNTLSFNKIDPYGRNVSQTQGATRFALDSIHPDPGQPRHLLPDEIAERFFTGQLNATAVNHHWILFEKSRQFGYKRSKITAIPCPPPMHMVTSA